MNLNTAVLILTTLLLPFVTAGCSTVAPLQAQDLAVGMNSASPFLSEDTVSVLPATANTASEYMRPALDAELFQKAIEQTLVGSRLFRAANTERGSKYQLRAEIIAQQPADPYSITVPILVHYRLVESATQRVIWKGNIFSQPEVPYERSLDDPTGARRHNLMLREGVRTNLKQLVISLQDVLRTGAAKAVPSFTH